MFLKKLQQNFTHFWFLYLHEIGSVFVDEGAESQSVSERRGHVGDVHIPVALTPEPAPLLQRLHGRHPGAQIPQ